MMDVIMTKASIECLRSLVETKEEEMQVLEVDMLMLKSIIRRLEGGMMKGIKEYEDEAKENQS